MKLNLKIYKSRPFLYLISILLFLVGWTLASDLTPLFLPGPTATFKGGVELFDGGILVPYFWATLKRGIIGWVVGCSGVILGWFIGHSDTVERLFDPYVNFFRFLPPIVWVTVFLVWFGYNDMTRILLIAYAAFMINSVETTAAVHEISTQKIRAAKTLGADGWTLLKKVQIPASLPRVLTGMRTAMTTSIMAIAAVEMLTASSGLGYEIWHARLYFRLDYSFICIFLLGVIGFGLNYSFKYLGNKLKARYGLIEQE